MKTAPTTTKEWEQAFVAYFGKHGEIPVDLYSKPNPKIWKKMNKAKRGVKDYIVYRIDGKIIRHFSISTKSYYDTESPPFIPINIESKG